MTKIEIDSDVSMLTNKQLKINIFQFLDNYKDILIDNMRDPKVYDDPYIERDVSSLKKQFNISTKILSKNNFKLKNQINSTKSLFESDEFSNTFNYIFKR